jgi:Zn-dependent metalloprotease
MILGDRTASLGTVVHEFAHAVLGTSARFAGTGDSAALEEAFADIMAEAAAVDAGSTRAASTGVSRVYGLAVAVAGAERRVDVERALYRAFVYLMPSSATFESARAATRQSARDLFGDRSAVELALERAWTAVGAR